MLLPTGLHGGVLVIRPDFHVALVHFPIALLLCGAVIELLTIVCRGASLRSAGRWMILLGLLTGIPAATSGIFATANAVGADPGTHWKDVKSAVSWDTAHKWDELREHMLFNSGALVAMSALVVCWIGSSDAMRDRLYVVYVIVLLACCGAIVMGARHGGELVYEHGIGVSAGETAGESEQSAPSDATLLEKVERVLPPIQLHLTLAGWVLSFSLLSLGLSLRRVAVAGGRLPGEVPLDIAGAFSVREPEREKPVGAARFWLLVVLLGAMTALAGWWTVGIFKFDEARAYLSGANRSMAHSITGTGIVALALLLAVVSRFSQSRLALLLIALLQLGAIGFQVWIGISMMFDTTGGSLWRFN